MPTRDPIVISFRLAKGEAVTSNHRLQHYARAAKVADLRLVGALGWRALRLDGVEPMEFAEVNVYLTWGSAVRRDPANWHPTAKALLDGMVSGSRQLDEKCPLETWVGILPDDDSRHLVGPWLHPTLPATDLAGGMLVTFEFLPLSGVTLRAAPLPTAHSRTITARGGKGVAA